MIHDPLKTWATKDGRTVAIKDMTDSHLENTVRMLRRKAPVMLERALWQAMSFADSCGGDGAVDAAEAMVSQLEEMDTEEFLHAEVPAYAEMVKEINKRATRAET